MPNIADGSYSPSDWNWIADGIPLSGCSESGLGTAKFNNDAATVKQGADGTIAVSTLPPGRAGTVTIPFMQTSMSNNVLNGMFLQQQLRIPGRKFLLIGRNSRSQETVVMLNATITKTPDVMNTKEVEDREWEFQGAMVVTYGGYVI